MFFESVSAYIYSICRKYLFFVVSIMVVSVLAECAGVFANYQIKEVIDSIAQDQGSNVLVLLGSFVMYRGFCHLLYFVLRLFWIRYGPKLLKGIIYDAYKTTIDHSILWFDSKFSGEISSKIQDFQSSIVELLSYISHTLANFALILISMIFLIHTNTSSGICLLIFVSIYMIVMLLLMKKQMKLQEDLSNAKQKTVGIMNDSIANVFSVKVIGNLASEIKMVLNPAIFHWGKKYKKVKEFDAYYIDIADTIMIMVMWIAQMIIIYSMYKKGSITAGGFAFIASTVMSVHYHLYDVIHHVVFDINPRIADFRAAYDLIGSKDENAETAETGIFDESFKVSKGGIVYNNVTYGYSDGPDVLHQFNVNIIPGEKIGIVGKSGSGKSTFIKCLLKYSKLRSGSIEIDGTDISNVREELLRSFISVIPQDTAMFHRSIKENVEIARRGASMQEIEDVCKKALIHDDIMKMTNGYDSIVGERGVKVSGGQRQRIAIARAILKGAPILILDEATSSLDPCTERLLQQSIDNIITDKKKTMLVIAHRLSTLTHMDRIIVFDKGRLIESGSHKELIEKNGEYRKLWDAQLNGLII